MDSEALFTRREMAETAIRASLLPAGAGFFTRWLAAEPLEDYQPKFFSADDFAALQAFTEILIPTDDTPGAHEAQCAHYIDFVLQASGETPQVQTNWHKAMNLLRESGFHQANASQRLRIVTEISRPEVDKTAKHPAFFAYRLIKQQTVFAFYTSREGTIQTLDYKGNSYNVTFPACTHPEHQIV
jgi:hypothetical protein